MIPQNFKGRRRTVFRSMSEPLITEKEIKSDSEFIPINKSVHKFLKKGQGKLASNYQDEESEFSKKRKEKIHKEQTTNIIHSRDRPPIL